MQITQATDYALRALIYLGEQTPEEGRVSAKEIAEEQKIPIRFLLKIMRQLMYEGIVKSYRGNSGGYALAKPPQDITLLDVVEALEGKIILNRCLEDGRLCSRSAADYCKVHMALQDIQDEVMVQMQQYTLADFIS